jgi:hypothetical protein
MAISEVSKAVKVWSGWIMMGTLKWPISGLPSMPEPKGMLTATSEAARWCGGGLIRLDHDRDVKMADIRPSQHARSKRHADGDSRRQQGGGGLIRLDHDGDVEMADIRPSRHARTKGGGQTWTERWYPSA